MPTERVNLMTVLLVKCHFLCFTTTLGTDPSQPPTPTEDRNLMTILLNVLVPACAVLLLIVSAAIVIVYVRKRRRQNRAVKSMNRFEMMAKNPLYMEAGMVEYHY